MALQFTPQQTVEALQRAGDGPAVGLLSEDSHAHVLFHWDEDGHCYVFEIEGADELWMEKLIKLSNNKIVWAKTEDSFIKSAFALWPKDECVQKLVTLHAAHSQALH